MQDDMQARRRRARRQLRRLGTPPDIARLLGSARYWTEEVYLELEELCDRVLFEDPAAGLPLARAALVLAQRVPPEECRRPPGGLRRRRELEARALALLGGAWRRVGELDRAERAYRRALRIDLTSPLEAANRSRRLAALRLDQRRFAEALRLVDLALAVYEEAEEPRLWARAMLLRALIHIESGALGQAVVDSAAALRLIHPLREPRHYQIGVANLCLALVRRGATSEDLGRALRLLKDAERRYRVPRRSLPRLWIKAWRGLICCRLGSTRRGQALLEDARSGFEALGLPYETALVSLDLAAVYLAEGPRQRAAAAELAAATCRFFERLAVEREAIVALRLWCEAVRGGEAVEGQAVRDVLLAHAPRRVGRRHGR